MSLSCDWDGDIEPGMVMCDYPFRVEALATKRARNCCSCGKLIEVGEPCNEWRRYKVPEYDIEIAIWGDCGDQGPPRASYFHCVDCGLLADFLHGQKYVFSPADDMRELAKEHAALVRAGQAGCL